MKNFLTIPMVTLAISLSVFAGAVSLSNKQSAAVEGEANAARERLAEIEAAHRAAQTPIHLVEKPGQSARYAWTTEDGWMRSAPVAEDLAGLCDGIAQGQAPGRIITQGRTTGGLGPVIDAAALAQAMGVSLEQLQRGRLTHDDTIHSRGR